LMFALNIATPACFSAPKSWKNISFFHFKVVSLCQRGAFLVVSRFQSRMYFFWLGNWNLCHSELSLKGLQ
jgi:hypothetical protein